MQQTRGASIASHGPQPWQEGEQPALLKARQGVLIFKRTE